MTTSEARRHHLYERARASWDDEAAETLIESLPHPAAELASQRDIADLRAATQTDIADLRAEMHSLFRAQTWRFSGAIIAGMGVAAAIGRVG